MFKLEAIDKLADKFKTFAEIAHVNREAFNKKAPYFAEANLARIDALTQNIKPHSETPRQASAAVGKFIPIGPETINQLSELSDAELTTMAIKSDGKTVDGGNIALALTEYEKLFKNLLTYTEKRLNVGGTDYNKALSAFRKYADAALDEDSNPDKVDALEEKFTEMFKGVDNEEKMVLLARFHVIKQIHTLRRYQLACVELVAQRAFAQKNNNITDTTVKEVVKVHSTRLDTSSYDPNRSIIQAAGNKFDQAVKIRDERATARANQHITTLSHLLDPGLGTLCKFINNPTTTLLSLDSSEIIKTYLLQHPHLINEIINEDKRNRLAKTLINELVLNGFSKNPELAAEQRRAIIIYTNEKDLPAMIASFVNREQGRVHTAFKGSALEVYAEIIQNKEILNIKDQETLNNLEKLQTYITVAKAKDAEALLFERIEKGFSDDPAERKIQIKEIMDNLPRDKKSLMRILNEISAIEKSRYVNQANPFPFMDKDPKIDQSLLEFYQAFNSDVQVNAQLDEVVGFHEFKNWIKLAVQGKVLQFVTTAAGKIEEKAGKLLNSKGVDVEQYAKLRGAVVDLEIELSVLNNAIIGVAQVKSTGQESGNTLKQRNVAGATVQDALTIQGNIIETKRKSYENKASQKKKAVAFAKNKLEKFQSEVFNKFCKAKPTERKKIIDQLQKSLDAEKKFVAGVAGKNETDSDKANVIRDIGSKKDAYATEFISKLSEVDARLIRYHEENPIDKTIEFFEMGVSNGVDEKYILTNLSCSEAKFAVSVLSEDDKKSYIVRIENLLNSSENCHGHRARLLMVYYELTRGMDHPVPFNLVRTPEERSQLIRLLELQDNLQSETKINMDVIEQLHARFYTDTARSGVYGNSEQPITEQPSALRFSTADKKDTQVLLDTIDSQYKQVVISNENKGGQREEDQQFQFGMSHYSITGDAYIFPKWMATISAEEIANAFDPIFSAANTAGLSIQSALANGKVNNDFNPAVNEVPILVTMKNENKTPGLIANLPQDNDIENIFFGISDPKALNYYNISDDDLWKLVVSSNGESPDGGLISLYIKNLTMLRKDIENLIGDETTRSLMLDEVDKKYNEASKTQVALCGVLMNKTYISTHQNKNLDEVDKIKSSSQIISGQETTFADSHLINTTRTSDFVTKALQKNVEISSSETLKRAVRNYDNTSSFDPTPKSSGFFSSIDTKTLGDFRVARLGYNRDASYLRSYVNSFLDSLNDNHDIESLIANYAEAEYIIAYIDKQIRELTELDELYQLNPADDPIIINYTRSSHILKTLLAKKENKFAAELSSQIDDNSDLGGEFILEILQDVLAYKNKALTNVVQKKLSDPEFITSLFNSGVVSGSSADLVTDNYAHFIKFINNNPDFFSANEALIDNFLAQAQNQFGLLTMEYKVNFISKMEASLNGNNNPKIRKFINENKKSWASNLDEALDASQDVGTIIKYFSSYQKVASPENINSIFENIFLKMANVMKDTNYPQEDFKTDFLKILEFVEENKATLIDPLTHIGTILIHGFSKDVPPQVPAHVLMNLLKDDYRESIVNPNKRIESGALVIAQLYMQHYIGEEKDFRTQLSNYMVLQNFRHLKDNPLAHDGEFLKEFDTVKNTVIEKAQSIIADPSADEDDRKLANSLLQFNGQPSTADPVRNTESKSSAEVRNSPPTDSAPSSRNSSMSKR